MTKKKRPFTIGKDEHIVAVVPECCAGPGWANTPIWVYVQCNDGSEKYKRYCIQPEHQTEMMRTLFKYGAQVQVDLAREVKMAFGK